MVGVRAAWQGELSWISASSKFLVVHLSWLLFKFRRKEEWVVVILKYCLYSPLAPSICWDEKTLCKSRAHYTFQDSLAIQAPQWFQQPFVSNKGITDILRPVITCAVAQLFWPGANEARAWGSIPTQTNQFRSSPHARAALLRVRQPAWRCYHPSWIWGTAHKRGQRKTWERVQKAPALAQNIESELSGSRGRK